MLPHPRLTKPFLRFERDDIERSLPDRFELQVARYPHRLAVKTRTHALTYEALNAMANRVARVILDQRRHGAEPVALLMDQGAPLLAAILGLLKAGKFYVPLDPTYPQTRLAHMLWDSQAGLIVTDGRNVALSTTLAAEKRRVLNVDEIDARVSADNPGLTVPPDTLAYVFYTSGSSGQPKGVVDDHRNVLHNIMRYTNTLHICADDRLTLLQSASFSGSVSSLFSALLNGAAVFPFDLREEGPASLADWMIQERLTIYHSVPAIFRQVVAGQGQFPNVRLIRLEGDQAARTDVALYREHFGSECLLVNGLGATECGLVRQYFIDQETQIPGSGVPIGYPVEDMEVALLDDAGDEVGIGQTGDIAVRSRFLARGYWQKPDFTRAAFRQASEGAPARTYRTGDLGRMLPDGCLEHLGRRDFQVKVRGHRVEVEAIETALLAFEGIKEAVVMAREDRPGEPRLVAYCVPSARAAPSVTALRRVLAAQLPEHAIPSAYVMLDALPLSANGKLDRRALPPPGDARPQLDTPFVAAQAPTEHRLAAIWRVVLGLAEVGIHDDFFQLGGDSLLAMRVVARLRDTFRIEMPLRALFDAPTVSQLTRVIHEAPLLGRVPFPGLI